MEHKVAPLLIDHKNKHHPLVVNRRIKIKIRERSPVGDFYLEPVLAPPSSLRKINMIIINNSIILTLYFTLTTGRIRTTTVILKECGGFPDTLSEGDFSGVTIDTKYEYK